MGRGRNYGREDEERVSERKGPGGRGTQGKGPASQVKGSVAAGAGAGVRKGKGMGVRR